MSTLAEVKAKVYIGSLSIIHENTFHFSWLTGINGQPGFSEQAVKALKEKASQSDGYHYQSCSLMIDGMKLKQMMQFDQGSSEYTGFVNIGNDFNIDSEDLATEALVFLAVGVTGTWKQIIAYFLINGISASVQKELVLHAMELLFEIGIPVKALVMDGLKTNLSMLRKLGCSTSPDDIRSYFLTPAGEKVYCFIDACHCLKTVRNAFSRHNLTIPGIGVARWTHIMRLNDIQQKEGLHAANKLSNRHIFYQQQIMKVSCTIACHLQINNLIK